MPKGVIAQSVVVLFRQAVPITDLRPLLSGFDVAREVPAGENWEFGGPALTIVYRPEINGLVSIDTVDRPWPDKMGDPRGEPTLFGAWATGWFGPFTYPGNLARAVQQSWEWPEAKELVPGHAAFARLRLSYVFGAEPEALCLPKGSDSVHELTFLTRLVSTLLRHPLAICYFNPSGEALLSKSSLDAAVEFAAVNDVSPVNAWANVRLFTLDATWLVMDTVGNWQLDIQDHEMVFPRDRISPAEVSGWLRNTTVYAMTSGRPIKDGDTMDGPGGLRFQARTVQNGLSSPPREVLRWLPLGVPDIPAVLVGSK